MGKTLIGIAIALVLIVLGISMGSPPDSALDEDCKPTSQGILEETCYE